MDARHPVMDPLLQALDGTHGARMDQDGTCLAGVHTNPYQAQNKDSMLPHSSSAHTNNNHNQHPHEQHDAQQRQHILDSTVCQTSHNNAQKICIVQRRVSRTLSGISMPGSPPPCLPPLRGRVMEAMHDTADGQMIGSPVTNIAAKAAAAVAKSFAMSHESQQWMDAITDDDLEDNAYEMLMNILEPDTASVASGAQPVISSTVITTTRSSISRDSQPTFAASLVPLLTSARVISNQGNDNASAGDDNQEKGKKTESAALKRRWGQAQLHPQQALIDEMLRTRFPGKAVGTGTMVFETKRESQAKRHVPRRLSNSYDTRGGALAAAVRAALQAKVCEAGGDSNGSCSRKRKSECSSSGSYAGKAETGNGCHDTDNEVERQNATWDVPTAALPAAEPAAQLLRDMTCKPSADANTSSGNIPTPSIQQTNLSIVREVVSKVTSDQLPPKRQRGEVTARSSITDSATTSVTSIANKTSRGARPLKPPPTTNRPPQPCGIIGGILAEARSLGKRGPLQLRPEDRLNTAAAAGAVAALSALTPEDMDQMVSRMAAQLGEEGFAWPDASCNSPGSSQTVHMPLATPFQCPDAAGLPTQSLAHVFDDEPDLPGYRADGLAMSSDSLSSSLSVHHGFASLSHVASKLSVVTTWQQQRAQMPDHDPCPNLLDLLMC